MNGRTVRAALAVVVAVVMLLVGRGVLEGNAALARSDEAKARNDLDAAIAFGMYAAKWYVPFAPHVPAAYGRLRDISLAAELSGDPETALIGWQAIRAAALGTQSLWVPFDDRRREADEHIATLLGSQPAPTVDAKRTREQRIAEQRSLLAGEVRPKTGAVVTLYLGMFAWIAGAFWLARALDDDPRRAPPPGGRSRAVSLGLVLAVVGVVAFFVSLGNA